MDDTQRAWSDPDPDEPADLARLHGMDHTPRPLVEWCPHGPHGPYHAPLLETDGDPLTSGPGFGVQCHPQMLDQPLRWKRPRRIFVNSMSDLFHPDVPEEFIVQVFAVMACASQHTFQILTKRSRRMEALVADDGDGFSFAARVELAIMEMIDLGVVTADQEWPGLLPVTGSSFDELLPWPLGNVWLGVSIENDRYTFRADHLRETPAAVRWISAEPLLGPLPSLDLTGIDWLVVGGESGPGARPMHPDWARDLRDRCAPNSSSEIALMQGDSDTPVQSSAHIGLYGLELRPGTGTRPSALSRSTANPTSSDADERQSRTAFLFKQWGAWVPIVGDGIEFGRWVDPTTGLTHASPGHGRVLMSRFGKHAAGRLLDGRTWDEYPAERAS